MSSSASALRPLTARPGSAVLLDAALAAVVLVASLALLAHGGVDSVRLDPGRLDPAGVALAACAALPLAGWRRFPVGVFVLTSTASAVSIALGYPVGLLFGPVAALYLVAVSRDRDRPWPTPVVPALAWLPVAYVLANLVASGGLPVAEPLHNALACAAAWFAGERTRLRREQIADLKARAVRAEQAAERERRLAAAEERARIARDLHDSAGHAISLIAVRAGAARLRHHEDPGRSLRALQAVEELARQTVDDIDRIVATLREDGHGAIEAPPGLASLPELAAHHAATLTTTGTPRPLTGAVDQAAYRLLQEALTNATRHGTGAAQVELAFDGTELELAVRNRANPHGPPRSGGGHGLIGMRERAAALGGSLHTCHTEGTFHLRARIPYGGPRP